MSLFEGVALSWILTGAIFGGLCIVVPGWILFWRWWDRREYERLRRVNASRYSLRYPVGCDAKRAVFDEFRGWKR